MPDPMQHVLRRVRVLALVAADELAPGSLEAAERAPKAAERAPKAIGHAR